MKIFKVTIAKLKTRWKNRRNGNKLKIKVCVIALGFCRQTLLGLTDLLWLLLLGQTGLPS